MAYKEEDKKKITTKICLRIMNGERLRNILKEKEMPSNETFYNWLSEDEDKSKQYARACEIRADWVFDEMIEIADTTEEGEIITDKGEGRIETKTEDMLGHRKLKVDTRKWMLARMNPKKYGDKLDLTSDNEKIQSSNVSLTVKEIKGMSKELEDDC